jgi:aspartyl-tRNA(Asn)/glutamyl-tRNA(Gln) amidotransferase subunit B
MRSAAEAVAYAKALHALVRWIDICDGNMQEGSFRCDANVSVRRKGIDKLGTRCEIKNLNSFRFMERAIEFETRRQIEILEDGGAIVQETRLYDPDRDETRSMRSKEDAQDYRYFPDPDLLPLEVGEDWIASVKRSLPELPQAMRDRLTKEFGLSPYEANVLTQTREMASYYEALVESSGGLHKLAASWVMGELSAALKRTSLEIDNSPVSSQRLAGLLKRIEDNTISGRTAKDVFDAMWNTNVEADAVISDRGLRQISDAGALEKIVDGVLAANPGQVAEYRAGREKAFNFLVGQAMKASQGKANPTHINEILKRKLAA